MGIVSLPFLGVTLGAALLIRLFGQRLPRDLLLLIVSSIFIFCMAGGAVSAILPFCILLLGGFAVIRCARFAKASAALVLLAVLVVLAWWWLRTTALGASGAASGHVAVLGLSYAMFRIIHLTIDARDDELGGPLGFRSYLCYMTFFPNYLAGPVQRFQHFQPQIDSQPAPAGAAAWSVATKRAIAGVFKCTVLAGAAQLVYLASLGAISDLPAATVLPGLLNAGLLAAAILAFTAWLFFSFSGYMDVAISAGMVLGINIPENFNKPLQAKNFLDFWSRWHITLSDWFRFYIFNPLLKSLMEWINKPRIAPYLGPLGYFVAFFLMGVWHGRTPTLILYGWVLGAGVSINKLYQIRLIARLGRRGYMALCERKAYQLLAQSLALAYFALALCFLWQVTPEQLPIPGWAMLFAALLVFAACTLLAAVTRRFATAAAVSGRWSIFVAAVQAVAAAAFLWMSDGLMPELIYQWL